MNLSRQAALVVMVVLLALLVFGTQMPGAWRDEVFRVTQLPWQMTKVAHFVLFAGMACLSRLSPLRWSFARVTLVALALALLSPDGHPNSPTYGHPKFPHPDLGVRLV
jgi:hypothetical protein